MNKIKFSVLAVVIAGMGIQPLSAAELGKDLTPFGAQTAGNADWTLDEDSCGTAQGGTHLACVNRTCSSVAGSGANTDGCAQSGATCGGTTSAPICIDLTSDKGGNVNINSKTGGGACIQVAPGSSHTNASSLTNNYNFPVGHRGFSEAGGRSYDHDR